jgi:RimJ/RimL family protein N-acetyltransferase
MPDIAPLPLPLAHPRPFPPRQRHDGQFVSLVPQDPGTDAAALYSISHQIPDAPALWRYLPVGPFPGPGELQDFLQDWGSTPDVLAFTVRQAGQGPFLGSISLMSLRPAHGVGELGNIWFTPAAQRTKANTESNFLLLKHCFEDLGYRRMEWKCNALNSPSRRSALRLGFTFEGIFRQHMIVKGENRDTAWFAMLDHEWPGVKAAMERWLYAGESSPLQIRQP